MVRDFKANTTQVCKEFSFIVENKKKEIFMFLSKLVQFCFYLTFRGNTRRERRLNCLLKQKHLLRGKIKLTIISIDEVVGWFT